MLDKCLQQLVASAGVPLLYTCPLANNNNNNQGVNLKQLEKTAISNFVY